MRRVRGPKRSAVRGRACFFGDVKEIREEGNVGVFFDTILGRLRNSSTSEDATSAAATAEAAKEAAVAAKEEAESIVDSCVKTSDVGAANGVAPLDANSKVPVANLPGATNTTLGVVRIRNGNDGLAINTNPNDANYGIVNILAASSSKIDARVDLRCPIVPSNLDYAVRSVLPNTTTIPAATTAYSLLDASATTNSHSCTYVHVPSEAPTYTLPAVADATIVHEIVVEVLFTGYARSSDDDSGSAYAWKNGSALLYTDTDAPAVMQTKVYSDAALTTQTGTVAAYDSAQDAISLVASVSFLDSGGSPLAPQRAVSISPGTIIDYYCRWCPSSGSWKILPVVLS